MKGRDCQEGRRQGRWGEAVCTSSFFVQEAPQCKFKNSPDWKGAKNIIIPQPLVLPKEVVLEKTQKYLKISILRR